jgi:hypothetical protein
MRNFRQSQVQEEVEPVPHPQIITMNYKNNSDDNSYNDGDNSSKRKNNNNNNNKMLICLRDMLEQEAVIVTSNAIKDQLSLGSFE